MNIIHRGKSIKIVVHQYLSSNFEVSNCTKTDTLNNYLNAQKGKNKGNKE